MREALDGLGSDVVQAVAPREGDRFVVKPRYSGFDHTPLEIILRELEIDCILLAGAATEGCVVQTAIDGRGSGSRSPCSRMPAPHPTSGWRTSLR